jgi:tellurite resistance-related uncharacterized protein
VQREIVAFGGGGAAAHGRAADPVDGTGWAELNCLHRVPASELRPGAAVGTPVDCEGCDRTELPSGLVSVRSTDVFDEETVPAGLRRRHRVADRVWGVLVVEDGEVSFHVDTSPPLEAVLRAGDRQPIPPLVPHEVELRGPVRFHVEFHRRPELGTGRDEPSGPDSC